MINRIDQIRCMTIEYRRDKQIGHEVAMGLVHAPSDRYDFLYSPCPNDRLPDDTKAVAAMMVDDGFLAFEKIANEGHWRNPSWLVADWSKLRGLRLIANGDKVVWLMSDTHYPVGFSFRDLESKISCIPKALCVFLGYYTTESNDYSVEAERRLVESTVPGIFGNMGCYCHPSIVLSPSGANKLLEYWLKKPHLNFPELTYEMGKDESVADIFVCKPNLTTTIPGDSGWAIVESDKVGHGKPFDWSRVIDGWVVSKAGSTMVDGSKVPWWVPTGSSGL